MKKTLTILPLTLAMVVSVAPGLLRADPVKSEEEFDRAAGLFDQPWKPASGSSERYFPTPTPPQVLPGLPPWLQQPQGAQTAVPAAPATTPPPPPPPPPPP